MSHENIIVSPSGQLYGSENVLLDFLEGTTKSYKIYVPRGSTFYKKLKSNSYNVKGFGNLKWLYFKLLLQILFFRKNLFLNEGGHINYIKILAKLCPKCNIVIAIRLLEDCNSKLNNLTSNITLVAVSNFIKGYIKTNAEVEVVYDTYKFQDQNKQLLKKDDRTAFTIGIVGRVIETKGLDAIISIFSNLDANKHIQLNFYGTYNADTNWMQKFVANLNQLENLEYKLIGFEENKNKIYDTCDLILHLNSVEALGRIIFEAIEYNTPFLCFNKGGAGELAKELKLFSSIAKDENDMILKLKNRIESNELTNDKYESARTIIKKRFNNTTYAIKIESLL